MAQAAWADRAPGKPCETPGCRGRGDAAHPFCSGCWYRVPARLRQRVRALLAGAYDPLDLADALGASVEAVRESRASGRQSVKP